MTRSHFEYDAHAVAGEDLDTVRETVGVGLALSNHGRLGCR
jgi:hypothetical protein